MLKIIIDSRETNLYNNIIERDLDKYTDKITIIKEQLEIGDIHIQMDDLIYVYERKTVNDLLSSVKDSRYKEQKSRLLSNYKNVNYIIEGSDIIASNNKHNQNLLTSIYFNSTYRDNIKIFFTKNINDTITFLLMLSTKLSKSFTGSGPRFLENPSVHCHLANLLVSTKETEKPPSVSKIRWACFGNLSDGVICQLPDIPMLQIIAPSSKCLKHSGFRQNLIINSFPLVSDFIVKPRDHELVFKSVLTLLTSDFLILVNVLPSTISLKYSLMILISLHSGIILILIFIIIRN